MFNRNGKSFTYLPLASNRFNDLLKYHNPQIDLNELNEDINDVQIEDIYYFLYSFTENYKKVNTFCGLIEINSDWDKKTELRFRPLTNTSNRIALKSIIWNIYEPRIISSRGKKSNQSTIQFSIDDGFLEEQEQTITLSNADKLFEDDAMVLIKEIKERIDALKTMGITQYALEKLLQFQDVKLSRLVISSDYKICLPDYNNIIIEMSPLPKAVFLLFLKHPEGIVFKGLPDYRDELKEIYRRISKRENLSAVQKSIDDITDPTKNAINEKCSRIREAFISQFDDRIARYYYITGERLTPKKIILNRKLLEWQ